MSVFANKVISFENKLETLPNSKHPIHDLYFLKSTEITTYPCGRRNSTIIEGSDPRTTMDNFYYPFDPEARLNTEANNRRISSINGYTQNFIKSWDAKNGLHLVLGGYSFKIPNATNISSFCREKFQNFGELYANIRIEEIPLYESTELNYFSWVLRAQNDSAFGDPPCLDHLINANAGIDKANYYFSGLSFTNVPVVPFIPYKTVLDENLERSMPAYSIKEYKGKPIEETQLDLSTNQIVISLRIATKKNGVWELCQNSLLPDIRHGILPGEVELGHLFVEGNEEVRGDIIANNSKIPTGISDKTREAHAHFFNVTIDGDLIVKRKATFQSDVTIEGNLEIEGNLDVANTIDTKFLVASDAQVTGDISRLHGETPLGLVTVELKNSDSVQDPDDPKTNTSSITDRTNAWHTRPRLHIYTKNNATGPHKLTRVPLIAQATDPETN